MTTARTRRRTLLALAPTPTPPHVAQRQKIHAELAKAGFRLETGHGIFSIYRVVDNRLFIEGLDLARVMKAFRTHKPKARRAA